MKNRGCVTSVNYLEDNCSSGIKSGLLFSSV